jgi:hypothetical protein
VALRARRQREAIGYAALLTAALLGLGVAGAIVLQVLGIVRVDATACQIAVGKPPEQPPGLPWWGWLMAAAGIAAFTAGHITSRLRNESWIHGEGDRAAARRGSMIAHSVLVGVLGVLTVLAAYESASVAVVPADPRFWPISYFVRCANDVSPVTTLVALAVISFLLGHWLGRPWMVHRGQHPHGH